MEEIVFTVVVAVLSNMWSFWIGFRHGESKVLKDWSEWADNFGREIKEDKR